MILVVDKKETVIRYSAGSLLVEQPGKQNRRAPLKQLEQVIVFGNPMAETGVWRALASAGVPTVMLNARGKHQAAMLGSGLATQLPLRRMQYRCADDAEKTLAIAKWFIDAKLQSYDLPLHALHSNITSMQDDCAAFNATRDQARVKLTEASDISSLMGLEGSVARAWFALLARYLPYKWKFSGRNRRPPRDPVNALLSLGYTLVHSEIRQVLLTSGFDPSLGFLHQDYPGREALVLDFLEIFRSGVDCFVVDILMDDQFDETSFYYRDADGCRLSKSARPSFFNAWALYRENWPRPLSVPQRQSDWPTATLREQVAGQIALVRENMGSQELDHD